MPRAQHLGDPSPKSESARQPARHKALTLGAYHVAGGSRQAKRELATRADREEPEGCICASFWQGSPSGWRPAAELSPLLRELGLLGLLAGRGGGMDPLECSPPHISIGGRGLLQPPVENRFSLPPPHLPFPCPQHPPSPHPTPQSSTDALPQAHRKYRGNQRDSQENASFHLMRLSLRERLLLTSDTVQSQLPGPWEAGASSDAPHQPQGPSLLSAPLSSHAQPGNLSS